MVWFHMGKPVVDVHACVCAWTECIVKDKDGANNSRILFYKQLHTQFSCRQAVENRFVDAFVYSILNYMIFISRNLCTTACTHTDTQTLKRQVKMTWMTGQLGTTTSKEKENNVLATTWIKQKLWAFLNHFFSVWFEKPFFLLFQCLFQLLSQFPSILTSKTFLIHTIHIFLLLYRCCCYCCCNGFNGSAYE